MPTLAQSSNKYFMCKRGAIFSRPFCLIGNVTVCGTKYCLDVSRFKSVFKILLKKLIGCGYCYRSELMKSENCKPELIVTLKDEHYSVASLYTERFEIVCGSCRLPLHILEGEASFCAILAYVKHRKLIRLTLSNSINYVKGEIELFLVFKCYIRKQAVFLCWNNKVVVNTVKGVFGISSCSNRGNCLLLAKSCRLVFEDYRIEGAILSSDSDHTVRCARIEVNTVTGAEYFDFIPYLYLHLSLNDDVAFLALVCYKLNSILISAI